MVIRKAPIELVLVEVAADQKVDEMRTGVFTAGIQSLLFYDRKVTTSSYAIK